MVGDEENRSPQGLRDQARQKFQDEPDPLRRETQINWYILLETGPEQLTPQIVIDWLRAEDGYRREAANRELHRPHPDGYYFEFDEWSRVDDALKGATGRGDVVKTTDFLRGEAAMYERVAEKQRYYLLFLASESLA